MTSTPHIGNADGSQRLRSVVDDPMLTTRRRRKKKRVQQPVDRFVLDDPMLVRRSRKPRKAVPQEEQPVRREEKLKFSKDKSKRLKAILGPHGFSLHKFAEGTLNPGIIATYLIEAARILFPKGGIPQLEMHIRSAGHQISLKNFVDGVEGRMVIPTDDEANAIAESLDWPPKLFNEAISAVYLNVRESRRRIKWRRDPNIARLERLMRLVQDRGEIGSDVDVRKYVKTILDRGRSHLSWFDRIRQVRPPVAINLVDLVNLYTKALSQFGDRWVDVLEIVFNASWGSDQVEVPLEIIESKFAEWPPSPTWRGTKLMSGRILANAAFLMSVEESHGQAAIIYSAMAEDHFFEDEVDEGYYDFYYYEQARARAHKDLNDNPKFYYRNHRSPNKQWDDDMAKRRLKELFGEDFDEDSAEAFMDLGRRIFDNVEKSDLWIQPPFRELRRMIYGIIAAAHFARGGDAIVRSDEVKALSMYTLSRMLLGRVLRRRQVALAYRPDDFASTEEYNAHVAFIQPMRLSLNKLIDRVVAREKALSRRAHQLSTRIIRSDSDQSNIPPDDPMISGTENDPPDTGMVHSAGALVRAMFPANAPLAPVLG